MANSKHYALLMRKGKALFLFIFTKVVIPPNSLGPNAEKSAMVSKASLVQLGAAMTADLNWGWAISRSVLFSLGAMHPQHIANSSINSCILISPPLPRLPVVLVILVFLRNLD